MEEQKLSARNGTCPAVGACDMASRGVSGVLSAGEMKCGCMHICVNYMLYCCYRHIPSGKPT